MAQLYQNLLLKLHLFIKKYYYNEILKGLLFTIVIMLVYYLLVISFEHAFHFGTKLRAVLFYSVIGLGTYFFIRYILKPSLSLLKIGNHLQKEDAAKIIGKHFSHIEDKILNIIQLNKISDVAISPLLEASINQKIAGLELVSFQSAIDVKSTKKYLRYIIPAIAVYLIIFAVSPSILTKSTTRIVHYKREFLPEAPYQIKILNTSLECQQHEDYKLRIMVSGTQIPDALYLEDESGRQRFKKNDATSFFIDLKNLKKTFKFRIEGLGFYSPFYELTVLPKPTVLDFKILLEFPAYTRLKNQTINNLGDIKVPYGTKVNWQFKTKNTDRFDFILKDSTYSLNSSKSNQYLFSKTLFNTENYGIAPGNTFVKKADTIWYTAQTIMDEHPKIKLIDINDSLSQDYIYFRGKIADDYGFTHLYFNFSNDPSREESTFKKIAIDYKATGQNGQFYYAWPLDSQSLKIGSSTSYYFEIFDNDAFHRKSSKTITHHLKMPSLKELKQQQEESANTIEKTLSENILQAQELSRELKKLQEELVGKKKLNWEDKKKINDLLNQQKNIQSQFKKAQELNKEKLEEQKKFNTLSEEMLEKQEKVQEMFEKLMSDELKELYKEIEKLMEKLDKESIQQNVEQMQMSNKEMELKLDRALELFKQLEFEQSLDEAKSMTEKIKEKQEEILKETKNSNSNTDSLQAKQNQVIEDMKDLEKQLADLEEKNENLEFKNDLEKTEDQFNNAEQNMQKSKESLQQKNKKGAAPKQQDAVDQLQQLSDKLQNASQAMEDKHTEDLENMRQLLENLIQLSFDQEDIMAQLKTIKSYDPQYITLAQNQRRIKDDMAMVKDSLIALSKRVVEIEPSISEEITKINIGLTNVIEEMKERKTSYALKSQREIMTNLNNLAVLFDEIIQQMQMQMMQQKMGNSSCNKPGQGKPSASDLKKMQEALRKQLQEAKKQMEKGGGKEKGGESGGMSKELAKMAAEQEAIRNQLNKMAESLQQGEKGEKGNLDRLSDLMEETEVDIVNKRITEETLNRQEEIITRLLESEKAERERDLDDKRESKESKNKPEGNPLDYLEYKKQKERELELLRTIPPTLNGYYKDKVNIYFNTFDW